MRCDERHCSMLPACRLRCSEQPLHAQVLLPLPPQSARCTWQCAAAVVRDGCKARMICDVETASHMLLSYCRSFMARPVYSSDDLQADKHKAERFLHDGRISVATLYGPVTYPPSPVLAFDMQSSPPRLAFTGAGPCTCVRTGRKCARCVMCRL
jgi:40S ribosome biogenesis protein Tsr1 and BMS1 C-terminal